MIHCPYCGVQVQDDEIFCFKCGKQLPQDIEDRMNLKKRFNRFWLIPIGVAILFTVSSLGFYLFLQNENLQAEQLYEQGEEKLINKQYEQAKDLFEEALSIKKFTQADIALEFVKTVLIIEENIQLAENELSNLHFQEAISLINEAEHELRSYSGQAVTTLIDALLVKRNNIKLQSLQHAIEDTPTIDDLKSLLWEAKALNIEEAVPITEHIRNQIIDYTYSKASEQLNKHQFSDAQLLVDDGLKYAINSEKLLSLQTTIAKEKEAFETAQQERIEQAIHMAEEEREVNEMEAVELQHATVTRDEQGMLIIEGEVKSVATIPINSVSVEYSLLNHLDTEFITNSVFIFPDTLYPEEIGKFEFTHYDIDDRLKNIDIQINKITWYTE